MRADCTKTIPFITKPNLGERSTLSPLQRSHRPPAAVTPQPASPPAPSPWTPGKLCEQRGPKDLFDSKPPAKRELRQSIDGPPVSNPDDYPHQDTTPPGMMDMNRTRYEIDGKTYEKWTGMGPNGPQTKWVQVFEDGLRKP